MMTETYTISLRCEDSTSYRSLRDDLDHVVVQLNGVARSYHKQCLHSQFFLRGGFRQVTSVDNAQET